MGQDRLEWGEVGITKPQSVGADHNYVVREQTGEDVRYVTYAVPENSWRWLESGEAHKVYTLSNNGKIPCQLTAEELNAFCSVVDFRETQKDSWSTEVNRVVDKLMELTCWLHERQIGLGLLTPASLIVHVSDGTLSVFPADLGFVWEQPGNAMSDQPDWADDDGHFRKEKWGFLFKNTLTEAHKPVLDVPADLFKIARIVDWLLTGEKRLNVPDVNTDRTTRAKVWEVLANAESGKVESAKKLQEQLKLHRPSEHFLNPALPPTDLPRRVEVTNWGKGIGLTIACFLALAMIGALAWVAVRGPKGILVVGPSAWSTLTSVQQPASNRPAQALPLASHVRQKFEVYSIAAEDDVHAHFELLREVYETPPSVSYKLAELEGEHLNFTRCDCGDRLDKEMVRQIKRFETDIEKLDAVDEVRRIEQSLLKLNQYPTHPSTLKKEQSCLEYCQHWLADR